METRRFALLAVLAVIVFFGYQAWQKEYGPGAQGAASQQANYGRQTSMSSSSTSTVPQTPVAAPALPSVEQPSAIASASSRYVSVQTKTLHVRINLRGGGLQRVVLEKYSVSEANPLKKLVFVNGSSAGPGRPFLVFHQGFSGVKTPVTGPDTVYTAAKSRYVLAPKQKVLEVPLTYENPAGYTVHVIYRFHRGSYAVDLIRTIANHARHALQASPYEIWLRNDVQVGEPHKFVESFFGVGVYEQKGNGANYGFKKIGLGRLKRNPFSAKQTGGWLAMLQQYFIAVTIPKPGQEVSFSAKQFSSGLLQTQVRGGFAEIKPGANFKFNSTLYIGPKLQGRMDAVAPGLGLTEDYGLLTPVAKPLFWVLSEFHKFTGNWGIAIILLTLLVRGAFFKLSESQYRSMAKMRKFGPRIKELRERFADDKERLNKAMMELYKKEGFNPLAGCWPLVLQFPVFIALYWVLIESVELRDASFIFWLKDLSSPDPYFVLPVLYGITMWIQQRLSGQTATMDPTQQKLMSVMPIGLAGFFSFFPSGLVLYYVVSNTFTIAQQWVITRRLEKEGLAHR